MAVLTLRIPDEIRDQFKAVCAFRGKSMTEVLVDYMKQEIGTEVARITLERQRKGGRSGETD